MLGVREADEWQIVFIEIFGEGGRLFRTDHDDSCILGFEFLVILTQLRHVPAAERSDKAAVKNQ